MGNKRDWKVAKKMYVLYKIIRQKSSTFFTMSFHAQTCKKDFKRTMQGFPFLDTTT